MTQLQNSAHKMKMSTVPFVGDILPEPGAMVVSEHDGRIYYADKYGWHKADAEYSPVTIFIDFDGVSQTTMLWKAPAGSTVVFDWGDGTQESISGNDETFVNTPTNYSEAGKYYVQILGDYADITAVSMTAQQGVKFDIAGFASLSGLTYFQTTQCTDVYGSLESFATLTGCEVWFQENPNITGDVSLLKNITRSVYVNDCPNTKFSSVVDWAVTDSNNYWFFGNNWTSVEVDSAIRSIGALIGGTVSIYRNATRTELSNAAVLELIANGNTIILPENRGLLPLGPELFVTPCAVSDPAGNEINGLDGWTQTGLTGDNIFESQKRIKAKGIYSIKGDATPTPTSNASIVLSPDISVVTSDVHRVFCQVRHTGAGERWEPQIDIVSFGMYIYPYENEFFPIAIYKTAPDDTLAFRIRERSPQNSGGVYLDDFSVRKLLTP